MISQNVKDFYWAVFGRLSVANLYFERLKLRFGNSVESVHLNIGSGERYVEGFVNIEGNLLAKKDLWLDVNYGLPYGDETVDTVNLTHVLEHFSHPQAVGLLRECRRVLRKGAGLRVAVPSLDLAVAAFLRGDVDWFPTWPDEFESIGGRFHNYMMCRDQHRLLLDLSFLTEILNQAGFHEIVKCQASTSSIFTSEQMERLEPEESRGFFDDSLIVECRKGGEDAASV